MTTLAEFERRLLSLGDASVFDETHLHRAVREDDWGIIKTRDRLRAASVAALADDGLGEPVIEHDLGDMIAFATAQGWREHRWVRREGERIVAETLVVDGAARACALGRDPAAEATRLAAIHPVHAPLGELRSGAGQLAAPEQPLLPANFPEAALPAAVRLHRLWNARALHLAVADWGGPADAVAGEAAFALALLKRLPDATLTFERALAQGHHVALLWRLHGHDDSGKRIRAIGSSIATMQGERVVAERMLLDTLSIAARPLRPVIDYGG